MSRLIIESLSRLSPDRAGAGGRRTAVYGGVAEAAWLGLGLGLGLGSGLRVRA